MAKVSELAMNQAQAMSLYQEKSEKEALLEEAKAQYESGEIPIEDIEKDFVRAERRRMMKESEAEKKLKKEKQTMGRFVEMYILIANFFSQDDFYVFGDVRTKAEPRPNAYIPDAAGYGELPIPKPYGQHSPFKPQDAGAQMRHFVKPIKKPIEI